jgi:bile acid:Na+ symporter, BASS family
MRSIIREVFPVLLAVLIPLVSFTTGLQAAGQGPGGGAARLWRKPDHLSRDLLAILILVPLWVLLLVSILPLSPVVRAGLLVIALSVGIGPVASMKRMGNPSVAAREALDLNLVVLVISLLFVPIAFSAVASLFHRDFHVGVGAVAKVVLGRALIPLLLGLGAARLLPRFASTAGPVLMKIMNVVLLLVLVLALVATAKNLAAVGAVGWIVAGVAALGAVIIGHLLGGPDPGTRGVVVAASAMRFPALALVLAAVMPRGHQVIPVIIVYVLLSFLILTAYGALMARRRPRKQGEAVSPLRPAPRGA